MTIEQFKYNWQPQMDGYARFSFNLDLKELVQQIKTDAEAEQQNMCESCIHKVSADDIKAIRNSAIDEFVKEFHEHLCKENCGERTCVDDMDKCVYWFYANEVAKKLKESKE